MFKKIKTPVFLENQGIQGYIYGSPKGLGPPAHSLGNLISVTVNHLKPSVSA